MGIYETYSKRKKRLAGGQPDVYQYTHLPQPLKVQIVHIWDEAIGARTRRYSAIQSGYYKHVSDTLCREMGEFT